MKRSFSIPTTLQSFILFKIVRLTEDAKEILANMSTLLTIHINCFWQMSLWMTKGYIGKFSFSSKYVCTYSKKLIFSENFLLLLYSCMAKNGWGDTTACGLVDVITKLPELDSDDNNAEIIIASSTVIGVILLLVICLILYYALNQKKKRKQTDLLARNVVLWAKRVTVSQVNSKFQIICYNT